MSEIQIFYNKEDETARVQVIGIKQHMRNRNREKFNLIAVVHAPL